MVFKANEQRMIKRDWNWFDLSFKLHNEFEKFLWHLFDFKNFLSILTSSVAIYTYFIEIFIEF